MHDQGKAKEIPKDAQENYDELMRIGSTCSFKDPISEKKHVSAISKSFNVHTSKA